MIWSRLVKICIHARVKLKRRDKLDECPELWKEMMKILFNRLCHSSKCTNWTNRRFDGDKKSSKNNGRRIQSDPHRGKKEEIDRL